MANIIRPMNQISGTIGMHRLAIGKSARMERAGINSHLIRSIWGSGNKQLGEAQNDLKALGGTSFSGMDILSNAPQTEQSLQSTRNCSDVFLFPADKRDLDLGRAFAPAGQSTQMIIGATDETDLELIRTTQNLYKSFDLKRVFYSGYIPINDDMALPQPGTPVPLLREHRLYQADWLLRYYGFFADELLDEAHPFLDHLIDPKCNLSLIHI